jgi:hypothetical protein
MSNLRAGARARAGEHTRRTPPARIIFFVYKKRAREALR